MHVTSLNRHQIGTSLFKLLGMFSNLLWDSWGPWLWSGHGPVAHGRHLSGAPRGWRRPQQPTQVLGGITLAETKKMFAKIEIGCCRTYSLRIVRLPFPSVWHVQVLWKQAHSTGSILNSSNPQRPDCKSRNFWRVVMQINRSSLLCKAMVCCGLVLVLFLGGGIWGTWAASALLHGFIQCWNRSKHKKGSTTSFRITSLYHLHIVVARASSCAAKKRPSNHLILSLYVSTNRAITLVHLRML